MLVGPKYKICKRLGASVFEKCQTQKFQLAEMNTPRKTRPKRGGSDYGVQLLEKQKARFTYGMSEGQFSRYAHESMEKKGTDSASELVSRLESRLDNVVYRAGFTATRRASRQMVSHGHIMVNGRRMTIPSHQVSAGDTISIRPQTRESTMVANRTAAILETKTPVWMKAEEGGMSVKIESTPMIPITDLPFSAAVIIQFYSR